MVRRAPLLPAFDPGPAIDELERRYDGPVPRPLRDALMAGGAERAAQAAAAGAQRALRRLVEGQIAAIRAARRLGGDETPLRADLALYRSERARLRRLARDNASRRISLEAAAPARLDCGNAPVAACLS